MKSNWLTPRRSGYLGSLAFTAVMLALISVAKFGAWDSAFRLTFGKTLMVLTYPLDRLWEVLLPVLGFEGESVMIMAIPILISWVLYAAIAGFLFGWIVVRLGTKKEADPISHSDRP